MIIIYLKGVDLVDIEYLDDKKVFHLYNQKMSYVLQIIKGEFVSLRYWGRRIHHFHDSNKLLFYDRGFGVNIDKEDRTFSLDTLPQEFSTNGLGDFRSSSIAMEWKDGTNIFDARYQRYEIGKDKPALYGLPSSSGEHSKTLIIHFYDKAHDIQLDVSYTIFEDCDCIARNISVSNLGETTCKITKLLTSNTDFTHRNFDLLTLHGSHTNEKNIVRRKVSDGITTLSSMRGTSSPQQTPFIAVCDPNTNEEYGNVYAFSFIYSGNFMANVEVGQYGTLRIQMGLHPESFSWELAPKECFSAPEVVLTYSYTGFTGMSHALYTFSQQHIVKPQFRNQLRPILLNSWEAAYFDFTQAQLLNLARKAKDVGIELFVLDDGWFGQRNDDAHSLGDWYANQEKFPHGLDPFIHEITKLGLRFGIWVEPEMVNEESELYRKHPDWILHVPYAKPLVGRNQFVLDLSRADVCNYLIEQLTNLLSNENITYIKWDMNRHFTQVASPSLPASQQKEVSHRYVLGLYHILETLTDRFPHVVFEGCSSGGGRFDFGMLHYMPQTWTSDNTDAICRMNIQYGTSLLFPPITMAAHVSAVPNHQVGRMTPLATRYAVAMSANLGYELNLNEMSEEELLWIREQITNYKEIRPTIQQGNFYRLKNPFLENSGGWNFVSKDKLHVIVVYIRTLSMPAYCVETITLRGLDTDATYRNKETQEIFGGDELMYTGISIPRVREDFTSFILYFEKI